MDKSVTDATTALNSALSAIGYVAGQLGARTGQAGLQAGRLVAGQVVWVADAVVGARLVDAVARSRLIDRIVDVQVARILTTLEREPDRVRTLVKGQRESMVDELVDHLRAGATAGDERVDRLVDRLRRNGSG